MSDPKSLTALTAPDVTRIVGTDVPPTLVAATLASARMVSDTMTGVIQPQIDAHGKVIAASTGTGRRPGRGIRRREDADRRAWRRDHRHRRQASRPHREKRPARRGDHLRAAWRSRAHQATRREWLPIWSSGSLLLEAKCGDKGGTREDPGDARPGDRDARSPRGAARARRDDGGRDRPVPLAGSPRRRRAIPRQR